MGKLFLFLLVALVGCQSVQEKNQAVVRSDFERLKPLSTWQPTWCKVDTHLTPAALARYGEMFPDEKDVLAQDTWSYTWKARETSCEITALDSSPVIANHHGFLETAFCLLLQTHYVNSPFDELKISPEDISRTDNEQVQIRTAPSEPDLGLFLDPQRLHIETHTKSRGIIRADYSEINHQWLPTRLEQRLPKETLVIEDIKYSDVPVGGRRMIQSFWIAVGEDQALRHTQVSLYNCQNY